jgi:hypothetical protein
LEAFDFQAGVPRTAYRGVVPFMFNNHRVYLAPGANWVGYQPNWPLSPQPPNWRDAESPSLSSLVSTVICQVPRSESEGPLSLQSVINTPKLTTINYYLREYYYVIVIIIIHYTRLMILYYRKRAIRSTCVYRWCEFLGTCQLIATQINYITFVSLAFSLGLN